LNWGSFKRFKQVLAVGNLSSVPASCMQKGGYKSCGMNAVKIELVHHPSNAKNLEA
jgi:hypothetical protein